MKRNPWEEMADQLAKVLIANGVGGKQFDYVLAQYKSMKETCHSECGLTFPHKKIEHHENGICDC